MFDGIDVLTLPVASLLRLQTLYVQGLGFTVERDELLVGSLWQRLWALPERPHRAVLLSKQGSEGGWIRLVEVPGLPPADPAGRPNRDGPYALDFYVRNADVVEARIGALGWAFRSEPQYYLLPGTRTPVRERMLEQLDSGLLHAIVEYRPGQTRCVLGLSAQQDVSEVVAAVFFTDQIDRADAFASEVLGARRYFSGRFEGLAVQRMLGLKPGEGFQTVLFRGPTSRNARLEFAETIPDDSDGAPSAGQDPAPRVIAGCGVDDLTALSEVLAGGEHGVSTGVLEFAGGGPRLGLLSRYGAAFEFWQRDSRP